MSATSMSPAEMHHHISILLDRCCLADGTAPAECWLWVTPPERAAVAAVEASLAARLDQGSQGR